MVVNLSQQAGFVPRCDIYAINVDRRRNCYNCEGFGHIARNYRSWRFIGQGRRVEYGNNSNNEQHNLNREENLIVLD